MRWEALPTRQPGERLARLFFNPEHAGITVLGQTSQFRHWDGRIWQARIVPLRDKIDVEGVNYNHALDLTSAGCRPVRFIAETLRDAERTALRFANIGEGHYHRLVADSRGTSDHPQPGDLGVFSINTVRTESLTRGRTETYRQNQTGIGRLNNNTLVIFPTSDELRYILEDIATGGVRALVPQGVNELQAVDAPRTFMPTDRLTDGDVPVLSDSEVAAMFGRVFDDTASSSTEEELARGTYVAPRREHRVIEMD